MLSESKKFRFAEDEEVTKKLFEEGDTDGDGLLTYEEALKAFSKYQRPFSREVFENYDTNHDGKLSQEEPETHSFRIINKYHFCGVFQFSNVVSLSHKQLRSISFFILAWQLLICDIMSVLVQFLLVIPQTFAGYSLYSHTFSYAIGSLDTLSYNGALMFALLLTINRLCIFLFPAIDQRVFGRPIIYGVVSLAWTLLFVFFIGLNATRCYKTFSVQGFYLHYENCENNSSSIGVIFQGIKDKWGRFSTYVMLGIYTLITIWLKFANRLHIKMNKTDGKQVRTNKKEIMFFVQSFIICITFLLESLMFDSIPRFKVYGQWRYAVNFTSNCITIFMFTVHSVVIFTFNSRIKEQLKEIFASKGKYYFASVTQTYPLQTTIVVRK
ncbi:serpentine type 7TM GPCR chemoreceptor srx domain-containing protein [Ditylenchus destructor]|uniref:Serpentine type 7TM GPCR chemoreceptor srx domain-containing protein n=1 Tax=Ditylenchus destructor TaxID=166010 RepID=A0AAD4MLB8_9BILA|nr:serpentine type 7TM GPCR chemoreceptor srx domain-containing protein [Ditylenchus destructor]